jgi:hypothetical protein
MVYPLGMTTPSKPVPQKDAPRGDTRAERLAAALRENLKRRKAQARSQALAKAEDRKPVDAGKTGG